MGRKRAEDPKIAVGFRIRQSTLARVTAAAEKRGMSAAKFLAAVVERTYGMDDATEAK